MVRMMDNAFIGTRNDNQYHGVAFRTVFKAERDRFSNFPASGVTRVHYGPSTWVRIDLAHFAFGFGQTKLRTKFTCRSRLACAL